MGKNMGLDMYFHRTPKGELPGEANSPVIAYFRKHSDLHGWLERQWRKENHDEGDFNCVYMKITSAILQRLKDYLTRPQKERYYGFFWGESDAAQWEETRKLVPRLEEILNSGDQVYYYSWW